MQEVPELFTNSFYLSVTPIAPSRSTIVSTQPCTSVFESVFSIEENVKRSVMLFTAPVYESVSYTHLQVFSHYLYVFSADGYSTTSIDEVKAHAVELAQEGMTTNYSNVPQYTTQEVQVGSHQEDQGWYETETYVDYQYCDCGAIR